MTAARTGELRGHGQHAKLKLRLEGCAWSQSGPPPANPAEPGELDSDYYTGPHRQPATCTRSTTSPTHHGGVWSGASSPSWSARFGCAGSVRGSENEAEILRRVSLTLGTDWQRTGQRLIQRVPVKSVTPSAQPPASSPPSPSRALSCVKHTQVAGRCRKCGFQNKSRVAQFDQELDSSGRTSRAVKGKASLFIWYQSDSGLTSKSILHGENT